MKKSNYSGLTINGFVWFFHEKGVHSFQKKIDDGHKWEWIQCTEEQMHNGDIELMTQHGLTLSQHKIKQAHKQYEKTNEQTNKL